MSNKYSKVEAETLSAYSDNNDLGEGPRNLRFKASAPVSPKEATDIMMKASPGYNSFSAELLVNHLPADAQVWLAREGSVCVYVDKVPTDNPTKLSKLLKADEVDEEADGLWRIWWD